MGRAAVLVIGDELLAGRVRDANLEPLAQLLSRHGFGLNSAQLLPDDAAAIALALQAATSHCDVVLLCGGLGPTEDDLTSKAVAAAAQVPLERNAAAVRLMEDYFAAAGRIPSAANLVQADMPQGAIAMRNPRGTAPAYRLRMGRCDVVALPGVPSELRAIVADGLEQWLEQHPARGQGLLQCTLVVVGLPEAAMGARLATFMQRDARVLVGSYPREGEIRLVLSAPATAARELAEVTAAISALLGEDLVSADGTGLSACVIAKAAAGAARIAVAESLTGGLLTARLIDVPGASRVVAGGVVAYTAEQKTAQLAVPAELIDRCGVVSAECAESMARGVRESFHATHALAATGIAGPDGGSAAQPVGTVFIALATETAVCSLKLQLLGSRDQIRERTVTAALDLLRRRGWPTQ